MIDRTSDIKKHLLTLTVLTIFILTTSTPAFAHYVSQEIFIFAYMIYGGLILAFITVLCEKMEKLKFRLGLYIFSLVAMTWIIINFTPMKYRVEINFYTRTLPAMIISFITYENYLHDKFKTKWRFLFNPILTAGQAAIIMFVLT